MSSMPLSATTETPAVQTLENDPWLRIVVVTHNSGDFTQRCLDALAGQTDRAFEVVVVDNCSDDGAIDALVLPDPRFSLIRNAQNNGFSGGSNQGLRSATSAYLMTLNPDARLSAGCLAAVRSAATIDPNAAMLSPVLWRPSDGDGEDRVLDGAGDTYSAFGLAWRNGYNTPGSAIDLPDMAEVFGPSGAAAVYRRDLFMAEGGFNERFFCYYEDVDLALRLRARGGRAVLVTHASGVHDGGHSTEALPGFAVRQTARNGLLCIIESVPILIMPIILGLHITLHFWVQYRNRGSDMATIRAAGFKQGIQGAPRSLMARVRRRPYRIGASYRLGKQIAWRIADVRARRFMWWRP